MNSPVIVAVRKGSKGPGQVKVVVKDETEAEKVRTLIRPTLNDGEEIVTRPLPQTVVMTADEFATKFEAEQLEQKIKESGLSKLSNAERKALGL